MRAWAIILVLATIELGATYSLTLPCEGDRYRRCDLERLGAPKLMRMDCGLGHEHLC
jgi:hypothetical protein